MFTFIGNILKNAFSRPATRLYPVVKRQPPPGARGRLVGNMEQCAYCTLCAKRCPSNALDVDRAAKRVTFNPYACIVCGYCVEVCPKKCLSMTESHSDE